MRGRLGLASVRAALCSLAGLLVLVTVAAPAEARRKGSFGSKSSSSAPAAKSSSSGLTGALIGLSLARTTKKRLVKLHDLPEVSETRLPDGRHVHIGRMSGTFYGSTYIGYISRNEYIDLSTAQLTRFLELAGFDSVAEFELHLASEKPAADGTADTAAAPATDVEPAGSFGPLAMTAMSLGSLGLLGFIGYCLMSLRRQGDSEDPPTVATMPVTRVARVARPGPQAFNAAVPAASAPAAATPRSPTPRVPLQRPPAGPALQPTFTREPAATPAAPRRAPRDLSSLTRGPAPAFNR